MVPGIMTICRFFGGIKGNAADFAGCVESLGLMYLRNNFLQLHGFIVQKTVKKHF